MTTIRKFDDPLKRTISHIWRIKKFYLELGIIALVSKCM